MSILSMECRISLLHADSFLVPNQYIEAAWNRISFSLYMEAILASVTTIGRACEQVSMPDETIVERKIALWNITNAQHIASIFAISFFATVKSRYKWKWYDFLFISHNVIIKISYQDLL